jgi:hypothetical protein
MKAWLAIDNGTTGSVAFITDEGKVRFGPVPTKFEQNYTKSKQNITRIDGNELYRWILDSLQLIPLFTLEKDRCLVLLERPLVNPRRFKQTLNAHRAFEATLIIVESLLLPFQYIDSKEWQRTMLPADCEDLKRSSLEVGNRFFPQFQNSKCKDRDSLLMAEYARRSNL